MIGLCIKIPLNPSKMIPTKPPLQPTKNPLDEELKQLREWIDDKNRWLVTGEIILLKLSEQIKEDGIPATLPMMMIAMNLMRLHSYDRSEGASIKLNTSDLNRLNGLYNLLYRYASGSII